MWRPGAPGLTCGRAASTLAMACSSSTPRRAPRPGFELYKRPTPCRPAVPTTGSCTCPPSPRRRRASPISCRRSARASRGGAVYFEKRLPAWRRPAQTRLGFGKEMNRFQGGAIGKLWIRTGQGAAARRGRLHPPGSEGGALRPEPVRVVRGPDVFPAAGDDGWLFYERFQENLSVKATGRNAYNLQINFFPWAHFELMGILRYQTRRRQRSQLAPRHPATSLLSVNMKALCS